MRFRRPIGDWKGFKTVLKNELTTLAQNPLRSRKIIKVKAGNVELEVWLAPKPMRTLFMLIGQSDEQSGGWIVEQIVKNLKYCVQEKTKKIASVKHKYPEWWLVLPDLIGFGFDAFDKDQLRKQLKLKHAWNKIILLDPNDPCNAVVLPQRDQE